MITSSSALGDGISYDKSGEALRITLEIVENLDSASLHQLFEHNDKDLQKVLDTIFQETYQVLFGDHANQSSLNLGYMDKFTSSMEETLRCENINYFLTSVFPNFHINWHHLEWGEMVMRYNKLAINAPRGHGKSFYFSNIVPIWKMYRFKQNSILSRPRLDIAACERGVIMTNEATLGEELMEIMKDTIENNPVLAERLIPADKNNWAIRKIKTRNNARLQTKSYGTKFRGRHPGYLIADDFLDDSSLYSKDQRDKFTNYFHSVIMNAVIKTGQVLVVGTPFHENDLYGDLKKKRKNWRFFSYPAIFPNGVVLWSWMYNLKDLLDKREDQGHIIFSREQLCKPITSDASLFPHELIERSFHGMESYKLVKNRDSFPKSFERIVTGCDFAMSSKVGADFSVFTTWGVDYDGTMYLLHVWREKGKTFAEQMSMMKYINSNFRPNVMYLEANQFQQIFVENALKSNLPVKPHTTTGTNKNDLMKGVPGMAIMFEHGKIKFPRGDDYSCSIGDLFATEFGSIAFTDKGLQGVGAHDDCVMSTWIAVCASRDLSASFGAMLL